MKLWQLPKQRREIKYWEAYKGTQKIGENNSIALLKYQLGLVGVIYKAVR